MPFVRPNGKIEKQPVCWLTNLPVRDEPLTTFAGQEQPTQKIDSERIDIFNVPFIKQIPEYTNKILAVPTTFLVLHQNQYRVLMASGSMPLNGKNLHKRVIIQHITQPPAAPETLNEIKEIERLNDKKRHAQRKQAMLTHQA